MLELLPFFLYIFLHFKLSFNKTKKKERKKEASVILFVIKNCCYIQVD